MNKYQEVFKKRHTFLPVIHVEGDEQALRNVDIAREAGCDGIFLINHHMSYQKLLTIHYQVYKRFSDWWIGVNCLDLFPVDVFQRINNEVAGVWVDNAMVDERASCQSDADEISFVRDMSLWKGLYFGGVAFKYQRPVEDLEKACQLAMKYVDIVTTSGAGTGISADVDKIVRMKKALGTFPLAVASGITPENIDDYLDTVDCFLVATGISDSHTELNKARVKELVDKINGR